MIGHFQNLRFLELKGSNEAASHSRCTTKLDWYQNASVTTPGAHGRLVD